MEGCAFILSPFYLHDLTLIPAWLNNYIHYKVWNEIIYPFQNFNGCTDEVWEWISSFFSHFTELVITYPRIVIDDKNTITKRK